MEQMIDGLMVFVILANLLLLGSSRLGACIPAVGLQGFTLGLLPLSLFFQHGITLRLACLVAVTIPLRGFLFPWLLWHALRQADIRREIEPFVSYPVSIIAGVLSLVLGSWMASRLPVPDLAHHELLLPVAFSTILVGLFLIVSRRLAINQVLGYLVLENGIYILGLTIAREVHFLVEMGVLLDIFVAVFVMSIAVFRISREFDHMDIERLKTLREY